MADFRIESVSITSLEGLNDIKVSESMKIEVIIIESTWSRIKTTFSSWGALKNALIDWSSVRRY